MASEINLTTAVSFSGTSIETDDPSATNKVTFREVFSQQFTYGAIGSGTDDNKTTAPYDDVITGASPQSINFGNGSLYDKHKNAIIWGSFKTLIIQNLGTALVRADGSAMDSMHNSGASDLTIPPAPTGGKSFVCFCTGQDGLNGWPLTGGAVIQFISSATINVRVIACP